MWFILLEEGLQRLGSEDNPLTARVLGGLALALGVMGEQQQAMVYAERAVTMARRYDDPALLAQQPSSECSMPCHGRSKPSSG